MKVEEVLLLLLVLIDFANSFGLTEDEFKTKKITIKKSKSNSWFGIKVILKGMSHFISIECESKRTCSLTEIEGFTSFHYNFSESQHWLNQLREKNISSLKIFDAKLAYKTAWIPFLFIFKQFR